jgi:hypothetical protein
MGAEGVPDLTDRNLLGPRWVCNRTANRGQRRAGVVSERLSKPEVTGPTAP